MRKNPMIHRKSFLRTGPIVLLVILLIGVSCSVPSIAEINTLLPTNHAPYKPSQPSPLNNSVMVNLSPILRARIIDPDNNTMTVSFYNADTQSLIAVFTTVANNTLVEVIWPNRAYNTSYRWYVIAHDSHLQNKSAIWHFTTIQKPPSSFSITLDRGMGVHALITNTGNLPTSGVNWTLQISSLRTRISPLNITKQGRLNLSVQED